MQPLTREEILFAEEAIEDTVSSIRALVQQGREPEFIVNLSSVASMASDQMSREDYVAMLSVALWMLAKTDGSVDDGS